MGMDTILVILYILSFLLLWQFVGYPTFMAIVMLKLKEPGVDYSFQPHVSILVPTYNEETVIYKRIRNLLNIDYPKDRYEILVVDSGSTDRTRDIVEEIIKTNFITSLKLIKERQRNGKGSAINLGKEYANYSIILVTDANSIFNKNVLREILPFFKDPTVGAVGGRYAVLNPTGGITSSTQFYWDMEYIMRLGESILGSACLFHGEINAWRKELVDADIGILSEDLDMAIEIKRKGYNIKYAPNAIVYEPAPRTAADQIRQRKRTSIGTIQCIFKHWSFLFIPKNLYSILIFPSHKTLAMLSPIIIFLIIICYSLTPLDQVLIHAGISSFLFALILILFLNLKKICLNRINRSESLSKFSPINILYYVLLNEYLILTAWISFLTGRYSVLWQKAETTR